MNQSIILAGAITGLAAISLFAAQPATSVSAKTKITTNKTFKKTSFLPNSGKNIYVWNAAYNKKLHNLKNYPRTNLYSTKRVTIKTHNYFGSYYYVHSANNKIKGYVWHGQLIQGKYYKGGFYSYPTLNVLLSNRAFRRGASHSIGQWNASGIYASSGRIHGKINQDGISRFAKTPSFSDQKRVLNYLKKDHPYLPEMLNYGNHNGARIIMRKVYDAPNHWVHVPMIDILNGNATSGNWEEINAFSAVFDLAKLPNGAKPIATYDVNQVSVMPFGGRGFDFADPNAQVATYNSGPITHVYGNGFGPNHNLSLVDLNRWLRYVPTSNILKLSNTQPTLKDDIWYVAPTFQGNVSNGVHQSNILKLIDTSKSQYYRYVTSYGFSQYHYENGKWQGQYQVIFNNPTFNPGNQIHVTFANLVLKTSGKDTWWSPENEREIQSFNENDTEVLPYLYKPVSYYDGFLNNGGNAS